MEPADIWIGSKQEDINLMVDMGLDAYRFSISWSRLFLSKHSGQIYHIWSSTLDYILTLLDGADGSQDINKAGLDYYNALIDTLLAKGTFDYMKF